MKSENSKISFINAAKLAIIAGSAMPITGLLIARSKPIERKIKILIGSAYAAEKHL